MKIKNLAVMVLIGVMALGAGTAWALDPVKIIVDGREVVGDASVQIIDGHTMVPIRLVAESLDADVKWIPEKQQVIIHSAPKQPEESWNLMKVNDEPTTWPYWMIDGNLCMEYRNLRDLLETKYKAPWHTVDYNSINDSFIIDRKDVKVYPEQVGDFKVVPLQDLQRHGIIQYEWQAEQENLLFDLTPVN